MKITNSMISAYDFCPYSYYLKYVLNIKVPPTDAMSLGLNVHEKIASKFGKKNIDIEKKWLLSDMIKKKADRIYKNWEKNWYSVFKDDVEEGATNVEKHFEVDFDGDLLVGIADFITKDTAIDWKTGKYVSPTQLALYMYAFNLPKAMYIFLRATNRGEKTFEIDKYDYNGGLLTARQTIVQIKMGTFPKNEFVCNYCSLKEICNKEVKDDTNDRLQGR